MPNLNLKVRHHMVPGLNNDWVQGYFYEIFNGDSKIFEADEYFETEFRASLAGIGHNTLS